MNGKSTSDASPLPARVQSLDALRGLTILVMIFVNDLAGVQGVPPWMKHERPLDADGMTFVDVVFPAFLFIVGTSIPFAIGRRLDQGEALGSVWLHILTRSLGLLAIGVFMVNSESISSQGRLSPQVWKLFMYLGVILAWNKLPREPGKNRTLMLGLRAAGVALLAALAILYRGDGEPSFIELRPHWWGILGLIGWAYLVACLVYIPLRNHLAGVIGAVALLYCVYLANAAGAFSSLTWINRWIDIGGALGSHAGITVSGLALGMILVSSSPIRKPAERMRWALVYGLGLATAGYLLHSAHDIHRMFIINKIFATPPWCLLSSAITTWIWVAIYWLVDVRGWKRWAVVLGPAGQNPLLAYILSELLGVALQMSHFYEELGSSFAVGFWRSLLFALAVTWVAGRLRRWGIELRL